MEQFAVVKQRTPRKIEYLWDTRELAHIDAVARANAYNETMLVRPVLLEFKDEGAKDEGSSKKS